MVDKVENTHLPKSTLPRTVRPVQFCRSDGIYSDEQSEVLFGCGRQGVRESMLSITADCPILEEDVDDAFENLQRTCNRMGSCRFIGRPEEFAQFFNESLREHLRIRKKMV